ncbi:hypothetical protein HETIRDRAFT_416695 [Heterobasidion irregulare TC 32-1]|uniref:Uncharacterized protein n=1 Tax=Heterobasidion irregulare (strain TC 32-1) TaxID=747525 RepID=W4K9N9_HETIT|nr:uncharacterized protein HETIRDRAFT_416695 [Heterobasidion irregulare TC 32-1]ETW82557.1 hypothetical protein HETIRDRAFT_416695 [Heterobasidion irregulare TC 32-1]
MIQSGLLFSLASILHIAHIMLTDGMLFPHELRSGRDRAVGGSSIASMAVFPRVYIP